MKYFKKLIDKGAFLFYYKIAPKIKIPKLSL